MQRELGNARTVGALLSESVIDAEEIDDKESSPQKPLLKKTVCGIISLNVHCAKANSSSAIALPAQGELPSHRVLGRRADNARNHFRRHRRA